LIKWLGKLFPLGHAVVEDVAAKTKGQKKWDSMFSPIMVGKSWFYEELRKLVSITILHGPDTKRLREAAGLRKISNKLANDFRAHCVDSWVLANSHTGGHVVPDNESCLAIEPLQFSRRQLHVRQPAKGGKRKEYGGTRSLGLKRGSLVKHPKHGVCYVGGASDVGKCKGKEQWRISLHSTRTGKRVSRNARPEDCRFLTYNSWRIATAF
jgi:hypothetical protein